MYMKYQVPIPESVSGITIKKIKKTSYVYYAYESYYDAEKGYSVPSTTTIGKIDDAPAGMMYPNTNFIKFFPDIELPDETSRKMEARSSCLRVGTFFVIRRIMAEYHLDQMIDRIIGKDAGLFLDLAAYSLITENNAGQYYPEYAYNHPLLTSGMRIYSDSKVSDFLKDCTIDQRVAFLNEWNEKRDHRERIYISYDSTNKHCQAGDIELAEFGHEKDKQDKPIFNYAIAYDRNNREPLFYEDYPGSINDISQLQFMLEKAAGYGYKRVGFILDRGYFSEPNIRYMDKCGYDFVIMVKGEKDLVSEIILKHKGMFEQDRSKSIRAYKVNGMTVKHTLYTSDEKERYFHIYYSDGKHAGERETVESRVDTMKAFLERNQGNKVSLGEGFRKYFELIYHNEGKDDERLVFWDEKTNVVNREISLCGYFVIITSEKMTAEEALILYKSRDASEKLFRGDKSYLGQRSMRCHLDESIETKIFIEFVALIVRNRIYTRLKDEVKNAGKKDNYMTVPAAIKELEKIEMIRFSDNRYRLDHAVTATQKAILKAFSMTAADIRVLSKNLSDELQQLIEAESADVVA